MAEVEEIAREFVELSIVPSVSGACDKQKLARFCIMPMWVKGQLLC